MIIMYQPGFLQGTKEWPWLYHPHFNDVPFIFPESWVVNLQFDVEKPMVSVGRWSTNRGFSRSFLYVPRRIRMGKRRWKNLPVTRSLETGYGLGPGLTGHLHSWYVRYEKWMNHMKSQYDPIILSSKIFYDSPMNHTWFTVCFLINCILKRMIFSGYLRYASTRWRPPQKIISW